MKKGKKTMLITILLVCFALSCVMFMQFKIVNQTDITSIETMRESELRKELANWKEKYETAETQYQEVKNKIEEYRTKKESNIETGSLIQSELEQSNMLLGKTDVKGEGIEITIRDTNSEDIARISANDLLSIVDVLRYAGAEAISINEERIITMSDIVDINNGSFIKVNGQRILSPYVIKAIGNKDYLESALVGVGGYVDELRKIGKDITINQSDEVIVKKYNEIIDYKYIND